jgi:cellulose synthase/poly-beta-1,6-N-acetylglucosamine synthase-like glycosyltransferase
VEALLAQDYPNFEVIVLDDRSTDATPEILRVTASNPTTVDQRASFQLQIISGSDLPAGWAGKPHALFQASAAARGEWLCFVDADTFLAREDFPPVTPKPSKPGGHVHHHDLPGPGLVLGEGRSCRW